MNNEYQEIGTLDRSADSGGSQNIPVFPVRYEILHDPIAEPESGLSLRGRRTGTSALLW